MNPNARATRRRSRSAGFSLAEVLVALAIFTLGFVAVAALIPSGALLQRETTDDVRLQHTKLNAEKVITAVGRWIDRDYDPANEWQYLPVPNEWLWRDEGIFPPEDRTYPMSLPYWLKHDDDGDPVDPWEPLNLRRYEWIPLIRDLNGGLGDRDWKMIAVTLRLPSRLHTLVPDDPGEGPFVSIELNDLDEEMEGATHLQAPDHFDTDDYDRLTEGADRLRLNDRIIDSFGNLYRLRNFDDDEMEIELSRGLRFEDPPGGGSREAPRRFFYLPHPTDPGERPTPLRNVTPEIDVERVQEAP